MILVATRGSKGSVSGNEGDGILSLPTLTPGHPVLVTKHFTDLYIFDTSYYYPFYPLCYKVMLKAA